MKAPMPFSSSRLLVFACAVRFTESAQAQLVADGPTDPSSCVAPVIRTAGLTAINALPMINRVHIATSHFASSGNCWFPKAIASGIPQKLLPDSHTVTRKT
jgi:hypothetical protein